MGVVADMAGGRARRMAAGRHYLWRRSLALRLGRPSGESLVSTWSEMAMATLLGVVFPPGGVDVECSFPLDVVVLRFPGEGLSSIRGGRR